MKRRALPIEGGFRIHNCTQWWSSRISDFSRIELTDSSDHFAMHIRQSIVSSSVTICQASVIEP